MRLHPDIIRMHIQDTTAAACRLRRGHRLGRGAVIGITIAACALLYFVARALS
jgi:hypothetical protein